MLLLVHSHGYQTPTTINRQLELLHEKYVKFAYSANKCEVCTQCNRMLCGRGAQIWEGAKSHERLVHPNMISHLKAQE
jgi:hypothetical protein